MPQSMTWLINERLECRRFLSAVTLHSAALQTPQVISASEINLPRNSAKVNDHYDREPAKDRREDRAEGSDDDGSEDEDGRDTPRQGTSGSAGAPVMGAVRRMTDNASSPSHRLNPVLVTRNEVEDAQLPIPTAAAHAQPFSRPSELSSTQPPADPFTARQTIEPELSEQIQVDVNRANLQPSQVMVAQAVKEILDNARGAGAMTELAAQMLLDRGQLDAMAAFATAVANFAQESLAIGTVVTSQATHTRAWAVTVGVVAVDAVLIGRWYAMRRRRQRAIDAATFPFALQSTI